jgi:hypothetical protein
MKVLHLDEDKETLKDITTIVRVDLIKSPETENECKTNPSLESVYVLFDNNASSDFGFNYSKAIKDARFRVTYLKSVSGGVLNVPQSCANLLKDSVQSNWNPFSYASNSINCAKDIGIKTEELTECTAKCVIDDTINPQCYLGCIFGKLDIGAVCSRDNFAIRPDRYKIEPVTGNIKAGEEFNLTIKALNADNTVSTNYNETLSLSVSPKIIIKDNNDSVCSTGTLTIVKNANFVNGKANVTLKYNEVGDVNITVVELNDTNEFAAVDADDDGETLDDLIIKKDIANIKFIPYEFKINGNFANFNGGDFTYLSNDLNMSAELTLQIKAVNKDGYITKNYSKNCYSKTGELKISYFLPSTLPSEINKVYGNLDGKEVDVSVGSPLIFSNISKNIFNNGKADEIVKVNLNRPFNKVIEPFDINITQLSFKDADNIDGNLTLNQSANMVYGKITIPSVSVYDSSEANLTAEYLIYDKNNGWIVNKEHNLTVLGDINDTAVNNLLSSLGTNTAVSVIPQSGKRILEGKEKLKITTTHALPYSVKVHFDIPEWLWYHPLAKEYKAPSSSNLDCLTHPCAKITFQKTGSGWAGIGNKASKYNENNKTVKTKIGKEVNATRNEVKKLNW